MKKLSMFFVVLLLMLWSVGAWAQFKDGLWEITTQGGMKGVPQQMTSATYRQCITKSDPVPKTQDGDYKCKTVSLKMSGQTVHYTVECKGEDGTMVTKGKNTYTGSTMSGAATITLKMNGMGNMEMISKMKGKYIGPCPK